MGLYRPLFLLGLAVRKELVDEGVCHPASYTKDHNEDDREVNEGFHIFGRVVMAFDSAISFGYYISF